MGRGAASRAASTDAATAGGWVHLLHAESSPKALRFPPNAARAQSQTPNEKHSPAGASFWECEGEGVRYLKDTQKFQIRQRREGAARCAVVLR